MKAKIADWLSTTLKLSPDKTLITHWTDRVTFPGFECRGIKSRTNGVARFPRLMISQEAETHVKHTLAHLTRQTIIDPGDMIHSVNLVLKGWMNYCCYATNPHRVFARVLHYAYIWCERSSNDARANRESRLL